MQKGRFKWETRGVALECNIVKGEKYRFSLLTDRLIRMEYSESGVFEDRATKHFFYRDLPKTEFQVTKENGIIKIETEYLLLTYTENADFAGDTLSIRLKQYPASSWKFGEKAENLKGTAETLDKADGEIELPDGVCSRIGYAVVDDSDTFLLTDDGWFDIRTEKVKDFYFFGYGHDYLNCIKDFYKVTGAPPLLPDYALGNWWSRYYAYTQNEYCELMERFERENIPFSVSVVDMDWHTRPRDIEENRFDNPRYIAGWTGYSWNTELFPDYKAFLKFLKEHNLKTALNLHPAQGIGCHEDMYEEMAKACGVDPATRKLVKFDCLNPEFMEHYFDILHHPYEEAGVDFWWMDWQQGEDYWWVHDEDHPSNKLEQITPLWLLNHLHIIDINRNGKRPMFFSRYSGLGAHRYPVGFSGDTVMSWDSLDFQPYFTATASNVGYSWWSHDIGGHMHGYRDDEMNVRWMQLGVLSPINRLHSSDSKFTGKEPWNMHPYMDTIARDWLRLRHQLFPYIYTMNYRNHTELVPMVLPMYYSHPESEAAYKYRNQYWFGSELVVCPITEKSDTATGLARTKAWLPEGKWVDFFNGFVYDGGSELEIYRNLEQYPIFAKAGAIVPTEKFVGNNRMGRKTDMELYVFAGADNSFILYEDEGDYSRYKEGVFATTKIDFAWGNTSTLTINAADDKHLLLPEKRNWKVLLRGFSRPERVTAKIGGKEQEVNFTFNEATSTVEVMLENVPVSSNIEITCSAESLITDNAYAQKRIFDILLHAQIGNDTKDTMWRFINSRKNYLLFQKCCEIEQHHLSHAITEMQKIQK